MPRQEPPRLLASLTSGDAATSTGRFLSAPQRRGPDVEARAAGSRFAPPSQVRECGCPELVIRCVHWDGKIVTLDNLLEPKHTCGQSSDGWPPFSVSLRRDGEYHPALCGCPFLKGYSGKRKSYFENLPAAGAEFAAREAALLERADA